MSVTADFAVRFGTILFDTLLPITVGYVLHRRNLITREGVDWIIKLNVRGVFTVLSILSFWKLSLTWELVMLPVAGLLMMMVPFALMTWLTRNNPDPAERGALITAGMLGNVGTLGGVVAFLLKGPIAFGYVQILATLSNLVLILFNFPLCQKYRDEAIAKSACSRSTCLAQKRSFASLFFTWNQVALLGMLAGILLSAFHVPQPGWLADIFTPMVHVSAWIAFLPVGLLLNFKAAAKEMRKTVIILPMKFIVVPALMWAFCAATVNDPVMLSAIVISSAAPTAINAVLATALYGLKTDIAVSSLMTSTLVFAVLVCPILVTFFS